jgi:hypothetical protein
MERMMSKFSRPCSRTITDRYLDAQNRKQENNFMADYGKRQRILELNPKSPLIEGTADYSLAKRDSNQRPGLLRRVEQLPGPEEDTDAEAEEEIKEVVSILVDGALVRSGFEVSWSCLAVYDPLCKPRFRCLIRIHSSHAWIGYSVAR